VKNIELAIACDGFGDGILDACAVRDVTAYELTIATATDSPSSRGLGRGFAGRDIDVCDDDLGPFLGKSFRRGPANAPAAACDEGNLAGQPCHLPSPQIERRQLLVAAGLGGKADVDRAPMSCMLVTQRGRLPTNCERLLAAWKEDHNAPPVD
jgi:hypothetical protein